jgi:uncharacterized protein (TIGR02145 family)
MTLAPGGWRVATDADWQTMFDYLGGDDAIVIPKLKEAGETHWGCYYVGDETNETGFTAIPGGYREADGSWQLLDCFALWWTSSDTYWMIFDWMGSSDGLDKDVLGMSVRLIKN